MTMMMMMMMNNTVIKTRNKRYKNKVFRSSSSHHIINDCIRKQSILKVAVATVENRDKPSFRVLDGIILYTYTIFRIFIDR